MGTRTDGLFLYDGSTLQPFPTDVDATIKANNLYRGFVLANGSIALTTTAAGLFILDRQGHLLEQIDQQDGLLSPSVYYVAPDRDGGLWLALAVGLARVEPQSSFSVFGAEEGLRASGSDVMRHRGRIYVAHGQGVQYLAPATPGSPPKLVQVSGVANQCWAFMEFKDPAGRADPQLLLSASDGLYTIQDARAVPIVESLNRSFGAFVTRQSRVDPSRVWVGLADGIASVRWTGDRWVNEGRIEGITDQVRSLFQSCRWHAVGRHAVLWTPAPDPRGCRRRTAVRNPRSTDSAPSRGSPIGFATVIPVRDTFYVSVLGKITRFDEASRPVRRGSHVRSGDDAIPIRTSSSSSRGPTAESTSRRGVTRPC